MSSYLLSEVCDAVAATLGTAVGIKQTESFDELMESEAADDLPALQVYPESSPGDPTVWGDRTAFRGGTRVTEFLLNMDIYVAVRGELKENMANVTNMMDAMITVLQAAGRDAPPFFGVGSEPIKAFKWGFRRATFRYSKQLYAGVRFMLTIRIW